MANELQIAEHKMLELLEAEIKLIDDMARNVGERYRNRLYPFRQLCLGYLIIARNNAEAAIRLIKENLAYQIHYISRNTFEMLVTLVYIENSERKDELAKRYFEFHVVGNFKAMKMMRDYPEIFNGIASDEQDRNIEEKYKEYCSEYGEKSPKYWSGEDLYKMIVNIKPDDVKSELLKRYRIIVGMNNIFLHPTPLYLNRAINAYYNKEPDYHTRGMQINSITTSLYGIINAFLKQFPKGRPDFKKRLGEINAGINAIVADLNKRGLLKGK